jgi:hypothetical protein
MIIVYDMTFGILSQIIRSWLRFNNVLEYVKDALMIDMCR